MRRVLRDPSCSRLILAALWHPESVSAQILKQTIEEMFGLIRSQTDGFDFSYTNYYEREMGTGLKKCFFEIEGLCSRDALVDYKLKTTAFEESHSASSGRRVNVDPMLLSLENLVIASSKNFPHRVYLGRGVFADLAFVRRKKGFEHLLWTYPDYIEQVSYFEAVWHGLKLQLNN